MESAAEASAAFEELKLLVHQSLLLAMERWGKGGPHGGASASCSGEDFAASSLWPMESALMMLSPPLPLPPSRERTILLILRWWARVGNGKDEVYMEMCSVAWLGQASLM